MDPHTAYARWLDVALGRAEVIVALDYPRCFSLQRLVRRTVARAVLRTLICNGNRQSLRNAFSKNSLVAWHFKSFPRKRRRIQQWIDRSEGLPVLRFTSARQAERWVAALSAE